MRKIRCLLVLAVLVPLMAPCGAHDSFVIHGVVKGLDTATVALEYRADSGDDTTIIALLRAGKFTLTGQVPEPELVRLNIRTAWPYSISFFAENTDMSISMVKDAGGRTEIKGSPSNLSYQRLEPQLREYFENARNYDNLHQQAVNGHNAGAILLTDSIWAAELQQWMGSIHSAIAAQPRNYAGLYFIHWLLFHPPVYDSLWSLFMCLDPSVREGISGRAFALEFQHDRAISPGQPAPEISGTDTAGRAVTLASLRGHVVLIDFWASYCAICRQENPHLRGVYEQYHGRGFEVVSVSLDFERAPWIKAIQHDQLSWPQVSELRGGAAASAAAYSVQDLPRNWLIDPRGRIIAHDLSPDDLSKKLEEIMNGGGGK